MGKLFRGEIFKICFELPFRTLFPSFSWNRFFKRRFFFIRRIQSFCLIEHTELAFNVIQLFRATSETLIVRDGNLFLQLINALLKVLHLILKIQKQLNKQTGIQLFQIFFC